LPSPSSSEVPFFFPDPDSRRGAASGSTVSLYLAPWVAPISLPLIHDGAVAVEKGRILAVGGASSLRTQFAGARVESCPGVLLPGLVNAHVHLELSAYHQIPRPTGEQSFCDWIRALLQVRKNGEPDPGQIARAARQMFDEQHHAGTSLLLDIGNGIPSLPAVESPSMESAFLLELLGPDARAEEQVLARIANLSDSVAVTAHAPYSTTAGIMTVLKKRADRLAHVFSLHVAESRDEVELLQSGRGCFRGFLEERGVWDGRFPRPGMESAGVVGYLSDLGLLDTNLLCVHCVQVNEAELRMLAERGCKVCLCPGSNRFLGVGVAPLEMMLRYGLFPAIGTDSLASNEELDLWREMRILREDHPGVPPARVLAMATLGGAQALGREQDFGSLSPGRKARLLHADSAALQGAKDAGQILEILTGGGRPDRLQWMNG